MLRKMLSFEQQTKSLFRPRRSVSVFSEFVDPSLVSFASTATQTDEDRNASNAVQVATIASEVTQVTPIEDQVEARPIEDPQDIFEWRDETEEIKKVEILSEQLKKHLAGERLIQNSESFAIEKEESNHTEQNNIVIQEDIYKQQDTFYKLKDSISAAKKKKKAALNYQRSSYFFRRRKVAKKPKREVAKKREVWRPFDENEIETVKPAPSLYDVSTDVSSDSTPDASGLTAEDKRAIQELLRAHTLAEASSWDAIEDVEAVTKRLVGNLVLICGEISPFAALDIRDRFALLDVVWIEVILLWSVMSLNFVKEVDLLAPRANHDKNVTIYLEYRMMALKQRDPHLFESYCRFMQTFPQKVRQDLCVMVMLIAITLFNPDIKEVVDIEAVRVKQTFYKSLLYKYLHTRQNIRHGAEAYTEALKTLQKLQVLCTSKIRDYLESKNDGVGETMMDILKFSALWFLQ